MSRENVEIVQGIYDAFVEGDFGRALRALDDGVVWDLTHHDWPGKDVYRGPEGVLEVLSEWMGTFEDYRTELERVVDADDRVVAIQHETAVHRGSRLVIDRRTASIYTLRDGRAIRIDNYLEPDEALRAAGVAEDD